MTGHSNPLKHVIADAFSARKLDVNPSILPGPVHTEYSSVEDFLQVDWGSVTPSDLNEVAHVFAVLSPRGFAFLLGKPLLLTLRQTTPMLGNEMMALILLDLTADPETFVSSSVSKRFSDLTEPELSALLAWGEWLDRSKFVTALHKTDIEMIQTNLRSLAS